ncbi:MAG TPA: hypothetical protein VGN34_04750, partial [Ktedonobacteraceae bacterium]
NILFWRMLQELERRPAGSHHHWLYELEPMVSAQGFQECIYRPCVVDFSYGSSLHEGWKRDLNLLGWKLLPQMIEMGLLTQGQSSTLRQRMQQAMDLPTFHAFQYFLTLWAKKAG